jgi:hypothetical protein
VKITEREVFLLQNQPVAKITCVDGRWINMSIKRWWKETDGGKQKYWEKKFLLRPPQIPDGRNLHRKVSRTFYVNILCFV